ncbi:MAG TPA: 23S rRNA (pseudouridine(1915)-N(3))-methyltransferase RlmH [Candidatus Acidoferrales bacterium]|jgi:23S rRNA (pseudouridine1915-N3)-methyltransferase|nr:23S rRNA (pseudouridine(1915)-N(3))-methyltransferase RlmH [Candidatus Acidoferrales bacterium]
MKIHLVMLGKTRRPEIRALLDDYLARIGRFAEVQLSELREDSAASMRKLSFDPNATVVLLDDAGKPQTSAQFAKWLGETRDRGVREIIFLGGGAGGFPEALRRRATQKLSLSPLTFSHELARAMLAEQVYRAFAILAGHPYPK